MDLNYNSQGKVLIIELSGLFEYSDEAKLQRFIRNGLNEKPSVLALELVNVDSINSAGIAALLSILKLSDESKVELVLYGMNQKVMHLLEKVFSQDLVPLLSEEEFRIKYL